MKPKITLSLIFLLFVFSCKKDTNGGPIAGKWVSTEILLNINMSEPLYIQFTPPNKARSTFFSNCTGYSVNGNELTLRFTNASISQDTYTYIIKQDTLTLYPTNSSECTGCSFPFVKE